jgi:AcrR family transcriptional regulator
LFAASGFDGVSLRDIASKAGINVALVVRYFGGKDQLFAEAVAKALCCRTWWRCLETSLARF